MKDMEMISHPVPNELMTYTEFDKAIDAFDLDVQKSDPEDHLLSRDRLLAVYKIALDKIASLQEEIAHLRSDNHT